MNPEANTPQSETQKTNNSATTSSTPVNTTGKSLVATWLLAYFVGGIGVDRFYLGQIWTGILKLISFGGLGIWSLVDVIRTAFGTRKDKRGIPLAGTPKERKVLKIITLISLVFAGLYILGFVGLVFLLSPASYNPQRVEDINSLQQVIRLFETNVSGSLPTNVVAGPGTHDINICGPSCENDGETTTKMLSYNPKDVSIIAYNDQLHVPNTNTVYIVTNATCNNNQTGLGNTKIHDVAILYELKSIFGAKQNCASVKSYSYINVNAPPFCGISFSSDMSTSEYAFANARIEFDKAQAIISSEMIANKNQAAPGIIDDQLTADSGLVIALGKITFSPTTATDVTSYESSIKNYDNLIDQEKILIRDNSPIPTSLIENIDSTNSQRVSILHEIYADLGLPEPTCSFEGP
jgi:TM2 domain-containing membrane protein YozV